MEGQIINILRSRLDDCIFYEKGSGPAQWGDPRHGPAVDVSEGSNHPSETVKSHIIREKNITNQSLATFSRIVGIDNQRYKYILNLIKK